jgi:hypothetical protein
MRGRIGRWCAVVVAAAMLVLAVVPAAGARAGGAPSAEFCGAFAEIYAVQFLVALAEGFSDAADDETGGEEHDVGAEIYLVLSPRLERETETMLDTPPKPLENGLKRQLKVWRTGVSLLREDVGLDDDNIETIAETDVESTTSDDEGPLGDVSEKKIAAAGKKYRKSLDSLEGGTSRKEDRAFDRATTNCGIVPDPDVDCAALVTDEEATALLGEISETTEGEGCSWVGPDVEEGSEPALAVEVFATDLAYERLTGQLAGDGEPVPALGEQAAVFEGYSSQTLGGTSGRTLVAVVDGRTLQVALRLGDAEVTTEQLVGLANQVIGRL